MKRLHLLLLTCCVSIAALATVPPRDPSMRQKMREEARAAALAGLPYGEEAEEAGDAHARLRIGSQSSAPLKALGSPKVPVILVQFADKKFISGLSAGETCETAEQHQRVKAFYQLYANGHGDGSYYHDAGSAGAIAEYFRDQSNGQFTPTFEIIGPVTLSEGYAYYGSNGSSRDTNINKFFAEAISLAQNETNNWSDFDNDQNNTVDMAFFIYAGEGENSYTTKDIQNNPELANLIWPKERQTGGTIGGVKYGCYACCNETYQGVTDGIGVFVHELSHALGLPDFYDTNYVAYGLDYWDVMDSGCYCSDGYQPCGYSAYEKDFMGWQALETLNWDTPQVLTLQPQHLNGQAYRIVNPQNSNEYFVLENRQNRRWDAYIGRGINNHETYGTWLHHGMLITHVDYNASRWSGNNVNTVSSHQYITILPADGDLYSYMYVNTSSDYQQFLSNTHNDPFPGGANVTNLESSNIKVWTASGTLDVALRNIAEQEDGTVTLDFCPHGVNPEHPTTLAAADIECEYGDPIPPLTYTVDGADPRGEPILACNATQTSSPGTYDITIARGTVENTLATFVPGKLTILPAPLTITAVDQTIRKGDPLPTFTLTYEGLKNGETPSDLTKLPSIVCDANEMSSPAEYEIMVWGAESPNYDITYKNGTLTIIQPATVIAHNLKRDYGDPNPTLTFAASGEQLEGAPILTCEATPTSPVGTYPIKVEKGTITNPGLILTDGVLTIEPAPLTITADDKKMNQGEDLPNFTLQYKGFKNQEDNTVLTKQPTIECKATPTSPAGTYEITIGGAEASNYTITYVSGTLTIESPDAIHPLRPGPTNTAVYDLTGRRITQSNLQPGCYIVGGRKVIIR